MIKFIIPAIIVFLIVLFWEKIQEFFYKKFNIRLNYIVVVIFVIILTVYHFFLGACLNKFSRNENKFSSRFYRVFNEIPTLLLILIIFVVVFKPL